MKIVKFLGGLGNQMFQYAFYLSLKNSNQRVKADLTGYETYRKHYGFELTKVFNLKIAQASKIEIDLFLSEKKDFIRRKIRQLFHLKNAYRQESKDFGYEPDLLKNKSSKYYWGYWQNHNYFKAIEPQLRKAFAFNNELTGKNLEVKDAIQRTESVAIHVRRGDYINDPILGGICDSAYYHAAIDTIAQQLKNPHFFIFSDDIDWCRQNLNLNASAIFVTWNQAENSYIDLHLISMCKHYIISNSSFSWWGVWLNTSQDKIVVAPQKWANVDSDFSGLLLDSWTRI